MRRHLKTQPTIILLALLLSVGSAPAQENELAASEAVPATVWLGVKVVDAQGWEYAGVRLRWVQDGAALEIRRSDGAIKLFPPEEVARVFDAGGADITREVGMSRSGELTPPPAGLPPLDASGTEFAPVPATASGQNTQRLFDTALDAGVGIASVSGDWFAGLEAGINASGGLRFMTGDRNYLHFVYRYQSLGQQSFEIYDFGLEVVEVDASVHEFQFLVGRHTELVAGKAAKSVGYAEFGVAALNHRFSFSSGGGESLTRFGFVTQGGLMVLMSEAAALDLSISAVWKPGWSGDEGNGFVLAGHAGLTFFF